jgi:hypothetical protein
MSHRASTRDLRRNIRRRAANAWLLELGRELAMLVCILIAALAVGHALGGCVDAGDNDCGPAPVRPTYTSVTFNVDGTVTQPKEQFEAHLAYENEVEVWARCIAGDRP